MLIRFAVKNFRSIADEQELLLTASGLTDDFVDLITPQGRPELALLPSAVIYGHNGSGKSNILKALGFMVESVNRSLVGRGPKSPIPFDPFQLGGDWKDRPMEFEMDFISEGVRYFYGFSSSSTAFETEWLYCYPKNSPRMLFNRTGPSDIDFGPTLRGKNAVAKSLMRPNCLFLSAASQSNHEMLKPVVEFFSDYGADRQRGNGRLSGNFASLEESNSSLADEVVKFLTLADTGIVGRRSLTKQQSEELYERNRALTQGIQKVFADVLGEGFEFPEPDKEEREVEFAHSGVSGEEFYLPVSEESTGTQKLIAVLPGVFKALEMGGLVAIDELESGLHTKAAELVIGLFASRETNPSGAQLLVTTHDTNLMSSDYLRRDQVWLTEKSKEGMTRLFPVSDFHLRKRDNMERGYLQGRFGAVPNIVRGEFVRNRKTNAER